MFMPREGDEAWNKDVSARIEAAKNVLLGSHQSPETLVRVALNAMAYEPLVAGLRSQMEDIKKLRGQIDDLLKANPGAGQARPEGDQAAQNPDYKGKPGMRPMDATKAWTNRLPRLGGQ